jgi:uncharacterized protein
MTAVAIVTGASSGLGEALARQLLTSRKVVTVSRSAAPWTDAFEGQIRHVEGNVADPATSARAFEAASAIGDVDLVINCAGVGVFGKAPTFSRPDLDDVLAGTLIGTVLFSVEALKRFSPTGGGTIVNVMSTAAQVGRANETIYCAAKWGARGYTEALRAELKNTKIRVIAVYPGGMKTPFWEKSNQPSPDTSAFMEPEDVASYIVACLEPTGRANVTDIVVNRC